MRAQIIMLQLSDISSIILQNSGVVISCLSIFDNFEVFFKGMVQKWFCIIRTSGFL